MQRPVAVLLSALLTLQLSGCTPQPDVLADDPTQDTAAETPSPVMADREEGTVEEEEPLKFQWEFDSPVNHGVNGQILDALHDALQEVEIHSMLTVKDGVIIDEYYQEDYDETSVFRLASCSKSFSGALIGIAIDEGLIPGVDVKLSEYYPEIAGSGDADKQAITLQHLLTHTSGVEWYEWDSGTMFGEFSRSDHWVEFFLDRPMAAPPGTVFNYNTGGSHMLAAVLQQATGKTAYEYAAERLFEPLDMDSAEWRSDPQGVTDGGNGIAMTARDAAKFGQLYLNRGRWGELQVIPENWVEQSTAVQSDGTGGRTGKYGYQWWIRPFGEREYDTFFAMGHGGQYIFVVPELALVTVITSRFSDSYAPWPYFTDYILAACN